MEERVARSVLQGGVHPGQAVLCRELFALHLGEGGVVDRQYAELGVHHLLVEFLVVVVEPPELGVGLDRVFELGLGLPFEHESLLWVWKCKRPGLARHGALEGWCLGGLDEFGVRHPCWNTAPDPVSGGALPGVGCLNHRHRPRAGGATLDKSAPSAIRPYSSGSEKTRDLRHICMTARFRPGMNAAAGLTMRGRRCFPGPRKAVKSLNLMIF